jgi:hypothetical protein
VVTDGNSAAEGASLACRHSVGTHGSGGEIPWPQAMMIAWHAVCKVVGCLEHVLHVRLCTRTICQEPLSDCTSSCKQSHCLTDSVPVFHCH